MISALAAKMTPAARGADVAQLVEQLIRNEQVTGSIPAIGSIFFRKWSAKRPKGQTAPFFLFQFFPENHNVYFSFTPLLDIVIKHFD